MLRTDFYESDTKKKIKIFSWNFLKIKNMKNDAFEF
jgi:hypothetical protein